MFIFRWWFWQFWAKTTKSANFSFFWNFFPWGI